VDKYTFGTYKNKVIHILTLCLAGSPCGKLFPLWITIMTKKLDFDKMSGERYMGDNPFGGFWFPHSLPHSPTMSSEFTAGYSAMTTFSPLTIARRPFFYYV
jgi:hypothetical protein